MILCSFVLSVLSYIKNQIWSPNFSLCAMRDIAMWLKFWLQDPTGTIGASIHRKALSEGEFGKNISVGAVLVLQKVGFLFS